MKKQKLFKRALAAILTLTMALGILPVTAFAEEVSMQAEAAPVKATYYLDDAGEEPTTQVRVGATMLNVPKERLENGTIIAIMQDENGEYLAVDLNDQAALAEIDPNTLYFYNYNLQIYLVRVNSTQAAVRILLNSTPNFDHLSGSVYVKEYTSSLTSMFYQSGTLMSNSLGVSQSQYYTTLSPFNLPVGKEVNVGMREAILYLKDGTSIHLPYGYGYLTAD